MATRHTHTLRPLVKGAIGLASPQRAYEMGARRESAPTEWGRQAEPWLRRVRQACLERELSWA
jgi:hypothetical protein